MTYFFTRNVPIGKASKKNRYLTARNCSKATLQLNFSIYKATLQLDILMSISRACFEFTFKYFHIHLASINIIDSSNMSFLLAFQRKFLIQK